MERSLADLEVLILDCQATGSSPGTGQLLEIGWAKTRAAAAGNLEVVSYVIKLPEGQDIPPSVRRITGITAEDLAHGLSPKKAWKKLYAAAKKTAAANNQGSCATVIHYARYEEAFLRQVHRRWSRRRTFPFDIICTHEIIKVLLPHLPRKGLRAAAGFFGHSAPELRRSVSHVEATAFIWQHTVKLLKEQQGIDTWAALQSWLKEARKETAVRARGRARIYPMAAEIRSNLPDSPGVYRMLRSNGDLLYIGKAKSLKKRVNSYFRKSTRHGEHTLEMLTQAYGLDYTVTTSALEAALLESDEIKRWSPPYNVALREKERQIYFLSPDLRQYAPAPDAWHRLGPVTAGQAFKSLAAVAAVLEQQSRWRDTAAALGSTDECFLKGLEIFLAKHGQKLAKEKLVGSLLLLGKELWKERLDERARQNQAEEKNDENGPVAGEEDELEEGEIQDPESVTRYIEGIVLHTAHAVRRARWYCLLCESVLSWERGSKKDRQRIQLLFERGDIGERQLFQAGQETPLPCPPGYKKSLAERQLQFDLLTYDRVRVLTSEIRRIVSETEKRNIQLSLGPKSRLGQKELEKLLQWV